MPPSTTQPTPHTLVNLVGRHYHQEVIPASASSPVSAYARQLKSAQFSPLNIAWPSQNNVKPRSRGPATRAPTHESPSFDNHPSGRRGMHRRPVDTAMTRKQPYLALPGTRIIATSPSRSTYLEAKNLAFPSLMHSAAAAAGRLAAPSLLDSRTTRSFGLRCSASFNASSNPSPGFHRYC
ncbi:hypothetical protein COCMIDRAFT_23167 [Bipolaris oryzae ATCC 44560]|uniref:Uncharacterized protein n=1 Tax=Bipolaris oryzae ATCC 44560 TaxID=930090 RepID=W6ZBN9_COCMI|nr:uncharacterized protein COCMIDRAFT_23167 [Bipolaris oryzae ATCC 44560]EUC49187.1 hypothetical protein COCMIDRAFT_23167 [Bipolaris oryzae ATCC 44560]